MAHTRQKDEDETATPGAAGVSSSRHSSRAPENHWRIKISLPVGESPSIAQSVTAPLTQRCASRIRPDRMDHSWPAIHRVNAPERKRQVTSGCDRTSTAHQEANEIRGAYNHAAEFWQERR